MDPRWALEARRAPAYRTECLLHDLSSQAIARTVAPVVTGGLLRVGVKK
jgi:hypothetical protein